MDQAYLLEGIFKQSETKGKEYLLYLDVDRLLAPCYEAASKQPKNLGTEGGSPQVLVVIQLVIGYQLWDKCMRLRRMSL